uniref:Fatty acyl-AMP ligase n=1 Tax=Roseihalotalea indica TaxID=2867963 RepID=A0AA49JF23_9BACT|nr:fatty acyl-AMP ligase [Tunicatimonas sp. TK19036]
MHLPFHRVAEQHLSNHPEKIAYIFMVDGETQEQSITFQELIQKSSQLARKLSDLTNSGDRVILAYPPGLEYIIAFYACLYQGLIAVPAYPPHHKDINRISGIIKDSEATLVLCSEEVHQLVTGDSRFTESFRTISPDLRWVATYGLSSGEKYVKPSVNVSAEDTAFLQYTSGSTSAPKGVMVSHRNIHAHSELVQQYMGHRDDHVCISWLPPYHDMGLIGCIIHPFYTGMTSVLMSPSAFVKRPARWLQAISRYKDLGLITSGGPNFAYEMCCNYVTEQHMAGLDLSNWEIAFNGAEPVRASTLKKFVNKFKSVGFTHQNLYPVYGMAETTLMASIGELKVGLRAQPFNTARLHQNIAQVATNQEDSVTLVSCGKTMPPQEIIIADPDTMIACPDGEVGEVWVKGQCVTQGYWRNSEATERTFHAYEQSSGHGPFLRTGDLGFMDQGELFVTGRCKELIIINGSNYYPQDIEQEAEKACPELRIGCGAAFSIDINDQEKLVLVYELQRKYARTADQAALGTAIKIAVSQKFKLNVHDIVFIAASSFPKTTSGKLQRRKVRSQYLTKTLEILPIPEEATTTA